MRSHLKTAALAMLAVAVAASGALAQEGMKWEKDYKSALALGKDKSRLVVVHFWADW